MRLRRLSEQDEKGFTRPDQNRRSSRWRQGCRWTPRHPEGASSGASVRVRMVQAFLGVAVDVNQLDSEQQTGPGMPDEGAAWVRLIRLVFGLLQKGARR